MPVYKEGLKGYVQYLRSLETSLTRDTSVIMPTVESLLVAIRYYEAQGGTASIYVNEDGMQVVPKDLAE
jgi:hypothetical protein